MIIAQSTIRKLYNLRAENPTRSFFDVVDDRGEVRLKEDVK